MFELQSTLQLLRREPDMTEPTYSATTSVYSLDTAFLPFISAVCQPPNNHTAPRLINYAEFMNSD